MKIRNRMAFVAKQFGLEVAGSIVNYERRVRQAIR